MLYTSDFREMKQIFHMLVYQRFFPTLIDLIIGFLGLIIKAFDNHNQTEIFRELGLIIKPRA